MSLTTVQLRDYIEGVLGRTIGGSDGDEKGYLYNKVNAAFQEVERKAPRDFWKEQRGHAIYAPENITGATLTQYSNTFTTSTEPPDYCKNYAGCTALIGGSYVTINKLTETGGGVWTGEMNVPYVGSTATGQSFTVWCDSVVMDSQDIEVMGPVEWNLSRRLHPMKDRGQEKSVNGYGRRSRRDYDTIYTRPNNTEPQTGTPEYYYCDNHWKLDDDVGSGGYSDPARRIRLRPLPTTVGQLSYDARIRPAKITESNLFNETISLPVPGDYGESVILPVVGFHMIPLLGNALFANPAFSSRSGTHIVAQLTAAYEEALKILEDLTPNAGGLAIYPRWG